MSLFHTLVLGFAFGSLQQEPSTAIEPSLAAAVMEARAAVVEDEDGWRALCAAQKFTARFDGRGMHLDPLGHAPAFGLELSHFGRTGDARPVTQTSRTTVEGSRLEYVWGSELTEWYHNRSHGLEHGFDVHASPNGDGALVVELSVLGGLVPSIDESLRDVVFRSDSGVAHWTYSGLVAFDAYGEDLPARFAIAGDRLVIEVDDAGAEYPITIDPIAQQAYLKASNTDAGDFFGWSVAISGDTAIVGAFQEDSSATGIGGDDTDNSAANAGAVYVFTRSLGVWTQQAYLKASNADAGDLFGRAVAIDGDTIVVGAPGEDSVATGIGGDEDDDTLSDAGAVYVFTRAGVVWTQQAYVKPSTSGFQDRFGEAVDIDGDTLVVGAPLEDSAATGVDGDESDDTSASSGAAYVFSRTGIVWAQEAYLKASNTDAGDEFGRAVTVSGDLVAVGAQLEDSDTTTIDGDEDDNTSADAGAVYVFLRTTGTWAHESYIKAINTDPNDRFGSCVALNGNRLAVGAPLDDSIGTGVGGGGGDNFGADCGSVITFMRFGTSWCFDEYLKPAASPSVDYFGSSVAWSGAQLAIGAPGEQGNGVSPYADQLDNSAPAAGAGYVFTVSGSGWEQTAYLKPTNAETLDWFGTAIAISGTTVLVGAYAEDGGATGIDGDASDNSASAAGAAYVFDLCAPWAIVPGCLGNDAKFALPSAPAKMGTTVTVALQSTFRAGFCVVYLGFLEIDALSCGVPFGADELFLNLTTPPPQFLVSGFLDTSGVFSFPLNVPVIPTIAGVKIAFQAAVIEVPTFATELSDALEFPLIP